MATILIDCDPGVDDFLAIFMVLNHLSKSTTNILPVITTVGGNATIEDTTTNACSLLNFYKQHAMSQLAIDNIAIGVGATHPIEGKFKYAYEFHGANGLGLDLSKYHLKKPILPAKEILSKINSKKIDILAIGPLTNIATSLKTNPSFRNSVNSITIMGGAINSRGNITSFAEFNIYNDPIAAEYIFKSDIPTTLIPLNVTQEVYVSKSEMPWLKHNGKIANLSNKLISSWFNQYSCDKRTGFHFHDPATIAGYLDPTLFQFEQVSIKVDCSSSKFRGQTKILSTVGNTKLAVAVNSLKTKTLIYDLLNIY